MQKDAPTACFFLRSSSRRPTTCAAATAACGDLARIFSGGSTAPRAGLDVTAAAEPPRWPMADATYTSRDWADTRGAETPYRTDPRRRRR